MQSSNNLKLLPIPVGADAIIIRVSSIVTKFWDGSAINEWAYLAHQVPRDVFSEGLLFLSGDV
jgi:hypothetical protein